MYLLLAKGDGKIYTLMQLHPVQQKLLKILKQNVSEPLSIRELRDELEVSSPSVVQHHIKQLEKKGYLRKNQNDPRDYQVLAEPDSNIAYLNLYGMAQCGPNGQIFDGVPINKIPVYSPILGFPASEAFLVKAKGKSMEPDIHEGDMVVVRKTENPENNEIIVCCDEDGKVLIKRVQIISDKNNTGKKSYILSSLNNKFPAFLADPVDFRVQGVVKGVFKYSI